MDKLLLSIVVVSGLCAISSAAGRHYHVVYELKNMADAQRQCRENYTDLATIQDLVDLETLQRTVDPSTMAFSNFRAWIGLYEDLYNWRWSLSNTSFYKPGETNFRQWLYKEPNNGYRKENCTWMFSNGFWADADCEWLLKSVCFDVKGPNETLVFINTPMTWSMAQSNCRESHTDLAMVRNMEDNQKIQNLMISRGGENVWIGLFRDGWKWSDGSYSSFWNWRTVKGYISSEDCAVADFSANGKWDNQNCNIMSAFICYSVPVSKRVMKVRLQKRSSSLDLNDPVVMEGLLKQLQQRLKDQRLKDQRLQDQGLQDDIKLSWKKQSDGKVFYKEERRP